MALDGDGGLALVRKYLDATDAAGNNDPRYSDADIQGALGGQLSALLSEIAENGGDYLQEHIDVTTNGSGVADLSSYDPAKIVSAGIVRSSSSGVTPLAGFSPTSHGLLIEKAEDLRIVIIRRWSIGTSTNPLIYNASATAASWDAFERLLCARAAQELAVFDDEQERALGALIARYSASVIPANTIDVGRFPAKRGKPQAGYVWNPTAQTMQLVGTRSYRAVG